MRVNWNGHLNNVKEKCNTPTSIFYEFGDDVKAVLYNIGTQHFNVSKFLMAF